MKLILRCGGILRAGPERELVDDYLKRANSLAGRCGLHSVTEDQVDLKKCKNRQDETEKLISQSGSSTQIIALDERGKALTSRQIAKSVTRLRNDGCSEIIFLIGGADGFEPSALPAGTIKWSLGTQTWPHKLVRVMIAEQVYRALSILAGTPYHRD